MTAQLRNPLLPSRNGGPALGLIVSLAFVVLLAFAGFAASAQAQATSTPENVQAPTGAPTPASAAAEQETLPTDEQVSSAGELAQQSPSAGEEAPPSGGETLPGDEAPPTSEQAPPAPEPAPPSDESTQSDPEPSPPSDESKQPDPGPTHPTSELTPPPAEQLLPPDGPGYIYEEDPPDPEQKAIEKQAGKAGGEAGEERPSEQTGDSQTPAGAPPDHREAGEEVGAVSSIAATTSDAAMETPIISAPTGQSEASVTLKTSGTSERQLCRLCRALSACGISMATAGSIDAWLNTLGASALSTVALAAINHSRATMAATGALGRGRDNDAATVGHTSGSDPSRGPEPGGGGGGSAAGAGSGAASSASTILTGVLLHAAPNVTLRLYVSQPSWHTSFFALILERPD